MKRGGFIEDEPEKVLHSAEVSEDYGAVCAADDAGTVFAMKYSDQFFHLLYLFLFEILYKPVDAVKLGGDVDCLGTMGRTLVAAYAMACLTKFRH